MIFLTNMFPTKSRKDFSGIIRMLLSDMLWQSILYKDSIQMGFQYTAFTYKKEKRDSLMSACMHVWWVITCNIFS